MTVQPVRVVRPAGPERVPVVGCSSSSLSPNSEGRGGLLLILFLLHSTQLEQQGIGNARRSERFNKLQAAITVGRAHSVGHPTPKNPNESCL